MYVCGELLELPTPAVVVDLDVVENNIKEMLRKCTISGISHRPHIKTHRSSYLAGLQIAAGCVGITAAKLGEAEVMADNGIKDILIAYPLIGDEKWERLLRLSKRVKVTSIVNSIVGARGLSWYFEKNNSVLEVLIEIDGGTRRGGLAPLLPTLQFAESIRNLPGIRITGLLYYGGMIYQARNEEELTKLTEKEREDLVKTAQLLKRAGFSMDILSCGSSYSGKRSELLGGITEIRSGHYIFNDCSQLAIGLATPKDCALSILSTVVAKSGNQEAICDVGTKNLTSDTCLNRSGYGMVRNNENAEIYGLNEEHAFLRQREGNPPEIGDRIAIIPNHACVITNLADKVYGIRNGKLDRIINIDARGKST